MARSTSIPSVSCPGSGRVRLPPYGCTGDLCTRRCLCPADPRSTPRRQAARHVHAKGGDRRIVGHGEQLSVGLGCVQKLLSPSPVTAGRAVREGVQARVRGRWRCDLLPAAPPLPVPCGRCRALYSCLSWALCLRTALRLVGMRPANHWRPGGIASNDINKRDAYTNTIQTERLREKVKTELR